MGGRLALEKCSHLSPEANGKRIGQLKLETCFEEKERIVSEINDLFL